MAKLKREQIAGSNQNYRMYSFDYFLESQVIAGYESLELWLGAPHFWLDWMSYSDCSIIRKKCAQRGLNIVSTTSPSCGAFQYQYASQEKFHRLRSIEYFKKGICMTAELGARIMTVNSGFGYWDDDYETACKRSCETLSAVAEAAAREGIELAMESLTPEESLIGYSLKQIKQLIDDVGHPALKAMIDSGAIGYYKESSQEWFDAFGKDLIHYHFQDGTVSTSTPGHYAWGKGEFPLEKEIECMNKNGYEGYLTQEIVGSIDPRADDIINIKALSRFFDD